MRTEISTRLLVTDHTKAWVRRATFQDDGRLSLKEFLSADGTWKVVQSGRPIPDDCLLDAEVWVSDGEDADGTALLRQVRDDEEIAIVQKAVSEEPLVSGGVEILG